jgi:hypothetical protein
MILKRPIAGDVVVIRCADHLSSQADFVLGVIARDVEVGKLHLRDGIRIELGWSVLTLRREADGGMTLHEPDFDEDPFTRLRSDVSATLTVIAAQNDVLRATGARGVRVRFDQKIVLASGVLQLAHVYLQRSADVAKDDSGWFIGPVDEPLAEQLEAVYVYQLLSTRPEFLRVLTLPSGYLAIFSDGTIESIVDEDDVEVWQQAPSP